MPEAIKAYGIVVKKCTEVSTWETKVEIGKQP
jgi:hypothetical protein